MKRGALFYPGVGIFVSFVLSFTAGCSNTDSSSELFSVPKSQEEVSSGDENRSLSSVESTPMGAPIVPPAIGEVMISRSTWNALFPHKGGYLIPKGAAQLLPLPWQGVDTVKIRFNRDVVIAKEHLEVLGFSGSRYPALSMQYDPSTWMATFQIAPLPNDKYFIVVSDSVKDSSGVRLDGEWQDGSERPLSGNGAQGGYFNFQFNILIGDADRSGIVMSEDVVLVRNSQFKVPGNAGYSEFYDIDGSARIQSNDVILTRNNQFQRVPVEGVDPTDCAPEDPARSQTMSYSYRDLDLDGYTVSEEGILCVGDSGLPHDESRHSSDSN